MKCVFCQGELLEGKDKCDYCGRYQHEKVNPVQNQPVNNQLMPKRKLKKSEIGAMVFKTILTVAVVAVAAYFIIQYINSRKDFYGEWSCNEGKLIVTITEKTFTTNYDGGNYGEADYTLDSEDKNDKTSKYVLTVSEIKKLINGQEYSDATDTKFVITIEEDKKDEFTLNNVVSNKTYKCLKTN